MEGPPAPQAEAIAHLTASLGRAEAILCRLAFEVPAAAPGDAAAWAEQLAAAELHTAKLSLMLRGLRLQAPGLTGRGAEPQGAASAAADTPDIQEQRATATAAAVAGGPGSRPTKRVAAGSGIAEGIASMLPQQQRPSQLRSRANASLELLAEAAASSDDAAAHLGAVRETSPALPAALPAQPAAAAPPAAAAAAAGGAAGGAGEGIEGAGGPGSAPAAGERAEPQPARRRGRGKKPFRGDSEHGLQVAEAVVQACLRALRSRSSAQPLSYEQVMAAMHPVVERMQQICGPGVLGASTAELGVQELAHLFLLPEAEACKALGMSSSRAREFWRHASVERCQSREYRSIITGLLDVSAKHQARPNANDSHKTAARMLLLHHAWWLLHKHPNMCYKDHPAARERDSFTKQACKRGGSSRRKRGRPELASDVDAPGTPAAAAADDSGGSSGPAAGQQGAAAGASVLELAQLAVRTWPAGLEYLQAAARPALSLDRLPGPAQLQARLQAQLEALLHAQASAQLPEVLASLAAAQQEQQEQAVEPSEGGAGSADEQAGGGLDAAAGAAVMPLAGCEQLQPSGQPVGAS